MLDKLLLGQDNKTTQFRLCGIGKKSVGLPVNLHELRRIIRKTGTDQGFQWKEPDPEGAEFFSPAASVVSED